jgi:hypothetical protein
MFSVYVATPKCVHLKRTNCNQVSLSDACVLRARLSTNDIPFHEHATNYHLDPPAAPPRVEVGGVEPPPRPRADHDPLPGLNTPLSGAASPCAGAGEVVPFAATGAGAGAGAGLPVGEGPAGEAGDASPPPACLAANRSLHPPALTAVGATGAGEVEGAAAAAAGSGRR